MTIKIEAWQAYGLKKDHCVDRFEFCCWRSLLRWLTGFGKNLHGCPDCVNRDGHGNIVGYKGGKPIMSDKCMDGAEHVLNSAGYACAKCGMSAEHIKPKDVAKLPR